MKHVMPVFSLQRFFFALIGLLVVVNFVVLVLKPNTLQRLVRDENFDKDQIRLQSWSFKQETSKMLSESTTSVVQKAAKNKRDRLLHKEEKCVLPKVDPWDPHIRWYLAPNKNPLKDCKVTFDQRSFIDSTGCLWINKSKNETSHNINVRSKNHVYAFSSNDEDSGEPEKCSYCCVDSVDGSHMTFGNWTEVSRKNMTKPECEIFEVYCSRYGQETYKFLHSQIIPKKDHSILPPENSPDVHIILIDGVSYQHMLRALPATVHYLRTEMEALMFKYANKVGLNSRPNSYALLLGERAEDMNPNPWGPRRFIPGRDSEICKKYLEEENFIFQDFHRRGYKSMWSEDWWDATARWPNCWGFKNKPVDHFMQAYALRIWANNTEKLWERIFDEACRETYDYILDNLEDFVHKYANKPKVSLSWMTNVAHDNANVLYHTDQHFLNFFKRMTKKFSNSFVLFMSDHGNRYLLPTSLNIGEVEISNPFFALILPERLRQNKDLVAQIYRNTNELISHFDIYATLLEIATNGSQWTDKTNFSSYKYSHFNRRLKGSSLLHPLGQQPRTCERLEIPFDYCLCRHEYKEFQDSEIALAIAEAVVKQMNTELQDSDVASQCLELSINKTATKTLNLREFESQDDKRIFRASIRTLPSNGEHDVFAEYDKNGQITLISTRFPRNDSYKKQAHCIAEQFLKNYCYCKEQLPESKEEH